MGRLIKLIAQKKFEQDPHNIQERAKKLFKRFAQLSIPVLAPPPAGKKPYDNNKRRESTIVVSVDAGREEELISDMRIALDTLQRENQKLRSRVKVNFLIYTDNLIDIILMDKA